MNSVRWAVLTFLFATPLAAADYKVSSAPALTEASVSEAMRGDLQASGYRIATDSAVLCEIWFRKVVPQKAAGSDLSS